MTDFRDHIQNILDEAVAIADAKRLKCMAISARTTEQKNLDKVKETIQESAAECDTYCEVRTSIPLERLKELLPGFFIMLVENSEWGTRSGYAERYYRVEW